MPSGVTESRRLEIRCGLKNKDQVRKVYVHMLNGTLIATERALCCIVENYQTEEVIDQIFQSFCNTEPYFILGPSRPQSLAAIYGWARILTLGERATEELAKEEGINECVPRFTNCRLYCCWAYNRNIVYSSSSFSEKKCS